MMIEIFYNERFHHNFNSGVSRSLKLSFDCEVVSILNDNIRLNLLPHTQKARQTFHHQMIAVHIKQYFRQVAISAESCPGCFSVACF